MNVLLDKAKFIKILKGYVKKYQGLYESKSQDYYLTLNKTKKLLGLAAQAQPTTTYDGLILLAHLKQLDLYVGLKSIRIQSADKIEIIEKERLAELISGKSICALSGWRQSAFLPLLTQFLLQLYVKLKRKNDKNKLPYTNKRYIKNIIREELWISVNAFRIQKEYEDILVANIDTENLLSLFLEKFILDLKELAVNYKGGEQICFPCGYYAHAMYLHFIWYNDCYIMRIDNLGNGRDYHPNIMSAMNKDRFEVSALTLSEYTLSETENASLIEYLKFLCKANYINKSSLPQDNSNILRKIYNRRNLYRLRNISRVNDILWPGILSQLEDNCVVENYKVGMNYRMRNYYDTEHSDLYEWLLNDKFEKYSVTTAPKLNKHDDFKNLISMRLNRMGFFSESKGIDGVIKSSQEEIIRLERLKKIILVTSKTIEHLLRYLVELNNLIMKNLLRNFLIKISNQIKAGGNLYSHATCIKRLKNLDCIISAKMQETMQFYEEIEKNYTNDNNLLLISYILKSVVKSLENWLSYSFLCENYENTVYYEAELLVLFYVEFNISLTNKIHINNYLNSHLSDNLKNIYKQKTIPLIEKNDRLICDNLNFKNCNLSCSNFERVSFRYADFCQANLTNVNLKEADLSFSKLNQAVGLCPIQLSEADLSNISIDEANKPILNSAYRIQDLTNEGIKKEEEKARLIKLQEEELRLKEEEKDRLISLYKEELKLKEEAKDRLIKLQNEELKRKEKEKARLIKLQKKVLKLKEENDAMLLRQQNGSCKIM